MGNLPIEFYVYVGYGLFAMVVVTVFWKFMFGGLLGPWFQVKRSRGKMILIRIHHPVQDYAIAGSIIEGFLVYKVRDKDASGQRATKRIPMIPGIVSRFCTVNMVEVDEERNCFFKRSSGDAVGTYDAERVDNLLVRALTKPGLFGDQIVKILLILVIVALVAILAVGYLTYRNGQSATHALDLLSSLNNTLSIATSSGVKAAASGVGLVP